MAILSLVTDLYQHLYLVQKFLGSNQIAERVIKHNYEIPTPHVLYGFVCCFKVEKVNCTTRSVREAARSVARELCYPDLKPVQLKVREKGCNVFVVIPMGTGKAFVMDVSRLYLTSFWT